MACESLVREAGGVSLRIGNVYGPGMARNNVLSDILAQLDGKGPLAVRDGAPVRDFLWLADASAGIARAAHLLLDGQSPGHLYNLGSGKGCSVRDLAALMLGFVGQADRPIEETRPSARSSTLILDVSATNLDLGVRPTTPLDMGLRTLVQARPSIGPR